MSAMAPRTVRKTVAWYWDALGAGRSAGLQRPHTAFPGDTGPPQRTHLVDGRSMLATIPRTSGARSVSPRLRAPEAG